MINIVCIKGETLMKYMIIVVSIILGIVFIYDVLTYTGIVKGFYYKSPINIGNQPIYQYKYLGPRYKCNEILTVYEDDDYIYEVTYIHEVEGYYLKYQNHYIKLDEALKKNIITFQEIKQSQIELIEHIK